MTNAQWWKVWSDVGVAYAGVWPKNDWDEFEWASCGVRYIDMWFAQTWEV